MFENQQPVYPLMYRKNENSFQPLPPDESSYDNANRLTQIAQGTSTVGFSYDTANRRSTLTLNNGVNMSYTYDNESRMTGITYNFNASTLGNLTYSYDSLSPADAGGRQLCPDRPTRHDQLCHL
jgi:YD repeat-containing protein